MNISYVNPLSLRLCFLPPRKHRKRVIISDQEILVKNLSRNYEAQVDIIDSRTESLGNGGCRITPVIYQ